MQAAGPVPAPLTSVQIQAQPLPQTQMKQACLPLPRNQVRGELQAGRGGVVPVQQPEAAASQPDSDLDAIAFERLPPDAGLVAPIANDQPDAVLERPLPLLVGAQADLPALCLPAHTGTEGPVRGRMMLYAFKLLGRVTGRRVGDPA